jgi:hypothetical protein
MPYLADNTLLADLTPGGHRLSEAAIDAAHRMRAVMSADLDEYDMADRAREVNDDLNADGSIHEAWHVLNSTERAAWKSLLTWERPNEH